MSRRSFGWSLRATMQGVATRVLDGLAEGLTLRSVERDPATREELLDRFERMIDQRPPAASIEATLETLVDTDRIRPDAETHPPVYRLTQDGARRLAAYRSLPARFRATLVPLFRIDALLQAQTSAPGTVPGPPPRSTAPEDHQASAQPDPSQSRRESWVRPMIEQLPARAEIQAPYASVTLDRSPGLARWTLTVEDHRPGRYAGADVCPLTFLYGAAVRLLYGANAGGSAGGSGSLQATP